MVSDCVAIGRARALGERGRPEEASVSEEGAGLCIHAHGGEVASEGSIEEPCGVALLPVVGHDTIRFSILKEVTNTTAKIHGNINLCPLLTLNSFSFGTSGSNKCCRATRDLQLCLKCQSLIHPGWRDRRFQSGVHKT